MSKRVTLTDIEIEYIEMVITNHLSLNSKNNSGGIWVLTKLSLEHLKHKLKTGAR